MDIRESRGVSDNELQELRDDGVVDAEFYADCVQLKANPVSHIADLPDFGGPSTAHAVTSAQTLDSTPKP